MQKLNAYLIDPFKKEITQVEHNGDYKEIYKLIDCRCFNLVYLDDDDSDKEGSSASAKISLDKLKEMVSWPDAAIIRGTTIHTLNEDLTAGELVHRGESQIVISERD